MLTEESQTPDSTRINIHNHLFDKTISQTPSPFTVGFSHSRSQNCVNSDSTRKTVHKCVHAVSSAARVALKTERPAPNCLSAV